MNKKILVFNGSPRPKGNTSALINAFTKGAEESGNFITTFLLDSMNINGCKGCFNGGKDPKSPCIQKDDMDKIYPVYKEADVVVLATPLYYWTISGQLKTVIDRLFAVSEREPDYRMPKKDAVLLMAAGEHGFEESVYWYERLMEHIDWKDLGQVLAGDVNDIGDIEGRPELQEAYELGRSI